MEIKNYKEFKDLLSSHDYVVADFFAEWCGPCKMLSPIFKDVAEELKSEVKMVKINIDQNQELAEEYGVQSIPTIIYFKKGNEVDRTLGFMDKAKLISKINKNK